ncbi:interleukin-2 receptor subunit alpha isoform X2 [Rhineura floridana]|uniref:interleukin-2 receptor subunit alpha isoform X2 n=1 Tax=Rhineura floridana TaxID=261503 RepID=UPI002AC84903|nr:interleukin-2 receptor subunit alpha isoform X2 [Rhineura floridana]
MYQTCSIPGECPMPPDITHAEYSVEGYVVGTRAIYSCEEGYRKVEGKSTLAKCMNKSGEVDWSFVDLSPICEGMRTHLSTLTTTEPWTTAFTGTQPTPVTGLCGDPKPLWNATVNMQKYHTGLQLRYTCLEGYRSGSPISGVSICERSGGKKDWSILNLHCRSGNETESNSNGVTKQHLNAAALSIVIAAAIVIL